MALALPVHRFDIALVNLDPTLRAEIRKTRPCVVVSPDEVNAHSRTLMVAPLTTGSHGYPTRIPCVFQGVAGHVVVDQLCAVDWVRVVRVLGALDATTAQRVLATLQAYFAP